MLVSEAQLLKIWDKRISEVQVKISKLKALGYTYFDPDMKQLHDKLEYFKQCRRQSQKVFALNS
jgi:hypothetical protein